MTVYIVLECIHYEGCTIIGVYDTRQLAEEVIVNRKQRSGAKWIDKFKIVPAQMNTALGDY